MVIPADNRDFRGLKPAPARLRLVDRTALSEAVPTGAWSDLAADATEANPFFESWYLRPSLEQFGDDGVRTLLYEVDGTLCGLMPMASASGYYGKPLPHRSVWLHPNMFLGTPLVRKGHELGFWEKILTHVDSDPGRALFLHLNQLALDGPVFEALKNVCDDQSRALGKVAQFHRPVLDTKLDAAMYRDTAISKKRHKEWRRQTRLLREEGEVCFRWHEGEDDIERWVADFLRIEASGWKGEAGSALSCDDNTRTLFADALKRGAARNALIRCELVLDGSPIAMLVNFRAADGRTTFGYKTAIDADYRRFSPGVLLENAYFAILDEEDRTWCDSCAAPDHPVMSKLWHGRRSIGRVSVAIGGALRRAIYSPLLSLETRRASAA